MRARYILGAYFAGGAVALIAGKPVFLAGMVVIAVASFVIGRIRKREKTDKEIWDEVL